MNFVDFLANRLVKDNDYCEHENGRSELENQITHQQGLDQSELGIDRKVYQGQ